MSFTNKVRAKRGLRSLPLQKFAMSRSSVVGQISEEGLAVSALCSAQGVVQLDWQGTFPTARKTEEIGGCVFSPFFKPTVKDMKE